MRNEVSQVKITGTASLACSPTRRQVLTGGVLTLGTLALGSAPANAQSNDRISHSAESIHQEPSFEASRKRVYEALTVTEQFDRIIKLTGVMQSAAMAKMQEPTQISRHAGGAFALFGGYIVGRQIELVPNELIVQAWRVGNWGRGIYSMVRFDLTEQGAGTKILFDHAAFPNGDAEHLAAGWRENYWVPLAKFLA
jgi:activator of HSP90 ATPase